MQKKRFVLGIISILLVLSWFSSVLVAEYAPQYQSGQMVALSESTVDLPFDPGDYSFLIYVPRGDEDSIVEAMDQLGINLDPCDDIRNRFNSVTANDLATHDILIVGWDSYGRMEGLNSSVIENGITGRVILSGHDLDYHTVEGPNAEITQKMFIQAIDYVLQGSGTGLLVLGSRDGFPYIPSSWGISSQAENLEIVTEFTFEGLDSGIFDGLEPDDLSYWDQSYHNYFTIADGSTFVPLELGGDDGTDIITVANINAYDLTLTKTATLDPSLSCASPNDVIEYVLTWESPNDPNNPIDPNNLILVDHLPVGVSFEEEVNTSDGVYSWINHTVTWAFSGVEAGDQATRTIRVRVSEYAEPTGDIINYAAIYNDDGLLISAKASTPVCCWGGDILFVDSSVPVNSYCTGVSWSEAYYDLSDALARAARGCGDEIWIAKGTYIPGDDTDDTFTIPDGVTIYGGFAGNETSLSERDIINNPTILSGDNICDHTVTVTDASTGVIMDGLIIANGVNNNLSISESDVEMIDCWVVNSVAKGITSTDSDLTVNRCVIEYNGTDGIYCPVSFDYFGGPTGSGTLNIANAMIADNGTNGINCYGTVPTVINSFIRGNGWTYQWNQTAHGILLDTLTSPATIRNNTIAYNQDLGIYSTNTTSHNIRNCIIWHNDLYSGQLDQLYNCSANYSCVTNPADPNGGTSTPDLNGNITAIPGFVHFNTWTNFHLTSTSPCVNAGDPTTTGTGETDIDGHERVCNNRVDMGADEYYCDGETHHEYDLNGDGIINLDEFVLFPPAWLSDPNGDPNAPIWNATLDFNDDDSVDMIDFTMLVEDWLWQACYWTDTWYQLNQSFASPPTSTATSTATAFAAVALAAPAATTETTDTLSLSAEARTRAVESRVASQRPQGITLEDSYWLWGYILDSVLAEYDSGQYSLSEEEMIDLIDFIYDIMDEIEQEWLEQQ